MHRLIRRNVVLRCLRSIIGFFCFLLRYQYFFNIRRIGKKKRFTEGTILSFIFSLIIIIPSDILIIKMDTSTVAIHRRMISRICSVSISSHTITQKPIIQRIQRLIVFRCFIIPSDITAMPLPIRWIRWIRWTVYRINGGTVYRINGSKISIICSVSISIQRIQRRIVMPVMPIPMVIQRSAVVILLVQSLSNLRRGKAASDDLEIQSLSNLRIRRIRRAASDDFLKCFLIGFLIGFFVLSFAIISSQLHLLENG